MDVGPHQLPVDLRNDPAQLTCNSSTAIRPPSISAEPKDARMSSCKKSALLMHLSAMSVDRH